MNDWIEDLDQNDLRALIPKEFRKLAEDNPELAAKGTKDEIEELRKLAIKEGPVGHRASKLIARREPLQLRKIDPQKVMNSSANTAADLHLYLPELAEFLIEHKERDRLLKYRSAVAKFIFAAGKLCEVLDTLPQLHGVDVEPPITFDEISWQETIRGARERYRQYLESENEDSPPADVPTAKPEAKRTPLPQKLGPAKKLSLPKLKSAKELPPLKLRKWTPVA